MRFGEVILPNLFAKLKTNSPKILFYDSAYTGHHIEYLNHLLQYQTEVNFSFLIHPKAAEQIKNPFKRTIHIINDAIIKIYEAGLHQLKRGEQELPHILDFCKKENIRHLFFLTIDPYLHALGNHKENSNLFFSGIFFIPYCRMAVESFFSRVWLKKQWKRRQVLVLARQKNLKNVYLLNDQSTATRLNQLTHRDIFHYLPDPIPESIGFTPEILETTKKRFNINQNKKIYLLFGGLDPRKNVLNVLEAFRQIDPFFLNQVKLIICGHASPAYLNQIEKKLEAIPTTLDIFFEPSFVEDSVRDALFWLTDFVLMPYINFYGSSGILGHATKFKKPVIGPDKGLISELMDQFQLGISTNGHDSVAIKNAIIKIFHQQDNLQYGKKFLEDKTPEIFSKTLLNPILEQKPDTVAKTTNLK